MDNGIEPIKKRRVNPERITVAKESLSRLSDWIEQIATEVKGIKLNRNDLVNWLIQNHASTLSADEVKEVERHFFDEVKFAEWALKELKAAKARGETTSLSEILNVKAEEPKRKRRSKRTVEQLNAAPSSEKLND